MEMADEIRRIRESYFGQADYLFAKKLFEDGYRKQEWISVEDRLPTWEDGKVLIYTTHGISIAQRTTSGRWQGDLAKPKWITHWMPLPQPPKMKGGAE